MKDKLGNEERREKNFQLWDTPVQEMVEMLLFLVLCKHKAHKQNCILLETDG